jgi:hypothetical protein
MVVGMSSETFTLIHVLISLVGISSGIVVMYGFLSNQRLDRCRSCKRLGIFGEDWMSRYSSERRSAFHGG